MKRRLFVKTISAAGGALAVGIRPSGAVSLPAESAFLKGAEKSRVVIAQRADVRAINHTIYQPALVRLLDAAVENLFQTSAELAWKTLFTPHDVVALKVNCLAGKNLSTHPELAYEIAERLLQTGLKQENIIICDRRDRDLLSAGYQPFQGRGGIQCLGNDRAGFSEQIYEFGAAGSQVCNTISKTCTAIINLPIMKDHGIVGVSGALKNFFGVINNPNKYHTNGGDPFVADVNMLPPIRQKYRLTICDALTAQYEGGPPFMPDWAWPMNSLIAGTDMVAMDQVIWNLIEEKRAACGFASLEKIGRPPNYIATAADVSHRLGANDPAKIEVVRV